MNISLINNGRVPVKMGTETGDHITFEAKTNQTNKLNNQLFEIQAMSRTFFTDLKFKL